ncbi:glycosyltransferase family 117 protein [Chitinophaga lutea]
MSFNRINNIVGWIVCIVACAVYLMTMEATGSLWDCGEFISAAYKVQVPHPPGAPLFVLLGRIFTLPFSPSTAGLGVNIMSALASGFTILFLFWTITHFARRIYTRNGAELTKQQLIVIMGSGIVGALAYTFSDSFWFSAVEGEVYAMSSLFTALVFWAMLKWEHEADKPSADRWIVFIAYLMGLSIGVHLLNLLTIPAMVLIYYFRRNKNVTGWGTFWAFIVGCAITGIVQKFVIQDTIKASGMMDVFFVNSLGLPFFSGFIFYFVFILAFLIYGYFRPRIGIYAPLFIVFSVLFVPAMPEGEGTGSRIVRVVLGIAILAIPYILKQFGVDLNTQRVRRVVQLTNASLLFLFVGYSTYVTTMIRSSSNPSVDMYNVDNPISLVGYLGREQYGDFPLLYGQVFTAQPEKSVSKGTIYARGEKSYVPIGKKIEHVYKPSDMMLFPRVWDSSNDQGHADYYRAFLGLKEGEKPTFVDNIRFFLGYQVRIMYLRYFGWNFVGRQNDVQGFGNPRDGNATSGIAPLDNLLYGDQSTMPDSLKNNKAHNNFYYLPFVLGLFGFFFQLNRHRRDALVVTVLFFFTGMAIVLYLNQAGNQPRERDYAYVGSFYTYAIWIGLGVLSVFNFFEKRKPVAAMAAPLAILLCFVAVPLLMGQQGWDDHDRSKKVLARDVARDYLESCAPNAILFTVGDNDTYPLWYAQEVEGIRPDIRVINLSLLGVDWYIDQQRRAVNESPAVEMTLAPEKYRGGNRNYVVYFKNSQIPDDRYFNLHDLIKFVGEEDPQAKVGLENGEQVNFFPTKNVLLNANVAEVVKNGTVDIRDSGRVMPQIPFQINKNVLYKNDLAVYDIVATNAFKRPIYFTSPVDLGFNEYLSLEGLTYRLVPTPRKPSNEMLPGLNDQVNTERMYHTLMDKFVYGSVDIAGVYFDEPNRRMLQSVRNAYTKASVAMTKEGDKARALKLLQRQDSVFLPGNMPYALTSPGNMHNLWSMEIVFAYYIAGDNKRAGEISDELLKDLDQQMRYYQGLPRSRFTNDLQDDARRAEQFALMLRQWKVDFSKDSSAAREMGGQFNNTPDSGKVPADTSK